MPDTMVGRPAMSENIEARSFRSPLTTVDYVLRGTRFHLVALVSGSGRLVAEGADNELAAPCICWLPHGRLRTLTLDAGTRGHLLSVPDLALGRAIPDGVVGSYIRALVAFPLIVRSSETAKLDKIVSGFTTVERELYDNASGAADVVHHTLSLLLIETWRMSRPEIAAPQAMPRNLLHSFMSLVDLHLNDHWTVADYARHMGVSKDRLNSAVRRATGKPPLALVHGRLVNEAKGLLTGSGMQVAEIAYKLGFGDAAYFNRFFQRHAGMPPGRFRQAAQQRAAPAAEKSFAAWP